MAGLADALARTGTKVTYVAEQPMSADRAAQGWRPPAVDAVHVRYAPDPGAIKQLAAEAPSTSIHICQGFRGNGLVGHARNALARRGLRQWVTMEAVEEISWGMAAIKRLEYARLIRSWRRHIEGVLAIGSSTPEWLAARGMRSDRVFPFAYFLPDTSSFKQRDQMASGPFRVSFVGQFIERKRVDILIDALACLKTDDFELVVVGSGPLEAELQANAKAKLGDRVIWLGQRPIAEIPALMAQADCLVLPSRHDGWGAVVSEALMAGTPAICSDRCGAAAVVRASGCGGVFPVGDVTALAALLKRALAQGKQSGDRRAALAAWAKCLGAKAGASYLEEILRHRAGEAKKPNPPWQETSELREATRAI